MAGQDTTLPDQPFFNASIIYTALYTYVGQPHGEEGQVYVWQEADGYRKFRAVDGRLAGALLLNERHGSMALFKAIGRPVAQFGTDIARPGFPYNDLTGMAPLTRTHFQSQVQKNPRLARRQNTRATH